MKVSLSWLKEYVALKWDANRLAEALTMAGLEVDTIYDRFAYLQDVVVAHVETVRPHPKADKLKLCDVSTGAHRVTVVCGAPNVQEGMIAALALPGTALPDGRILTETQIRGVASQGMLCSAAELEMGADASGIWSLPEDLPLGSSLAAALRLSDIVLDIDLTPNRPDCLSMVGVAREAAALQGGTVSYPDTQQTDSRQAIAEMTSVTIEDADLCPRYTARLIEEVRIGPSPDWLQDRIRSVGMRPINNVVDITNFVMMELGQPLHAFDFDRLEDHRIVVRRARDGETFISLDNKERVLDRQMLMICDGAKPVAIGGVMGGLNSEVLPTTRRVLLESACFNPVSIRRTAKRLGLASEASHRFERGVDPRGTVAALNRAARLIAELGRGHLIEGYIDAHPGACDRPSITLEVERANRLLGTALTAEEIIRLLTGIEIEVDLDPGGTTLTAVPPSFRVDIHQAEDLIEEIARLWGYNRIPSRRPHVAGNKMVADRKLEIQHKVRTLMTGFGFSETINYSFISERACDLLKLGDDDPRRAVVKILNPITEDQNVMRTSLVPGLLETSSRNLAQQTRDVKIFEIGRIFMNQGPDRQPEERDILAALWTGLRHDSAWNQTNTACDFYDIKGALEGLLSGLQLDAVQFGRPKDKQAPYLEDGMAAAIVVDGQPLGYLGGLHREVLADFNLKQPVFILEIDLDRLTPLIPDQIQTTPLPRFPPTSRDITLIVDEALEAQRVVSALQEMDHELVETVWVFDVFKGEPIPPGKKSLSLRVVYRSYQSTLEDETVNTIHRDLTRRLLAVCNAELPS